MRARYYIGKNAKSFGRNVKSPRGNVLIRLLCIEASNLLGRLSDSLIIPNDREEGKDERVASSP